MIRIGLVNIDVSHPMAFSLYLEQGHRARYVAVYNDGFRGDDEVEGFIERFGLEQRCRSIEELADMVDIGFVQGCNWDKHLRQALPFIERGKPVFIDKPTVGTLADCRALEALAAQGKVILGSSSARYAEEVVAFRANREETVGDILRVFGTAGYDEFNYGVHVVEILGGMLGPGAVSTEFVGGTTKDGATCESYYVRYEDGKGVIYNTCQGIGQPFELVVIGTKGLHRFRVDTTKIYPCLLDRICDFMETGRSDLASVAELTESVKIMLAGRISRERGGVVMKLSDIPADDPGYDGDQFEREYAVGRPKIYRDIPKP